jgi:hypothetical protein
MTDSSNSSGEEVILNSSPTVAKKQISPAKKWCFTLNNYTESDVSSIVPQLQQLSKVLIVGREIGAECNTPHLQGYLEFLTKRRPLSLNLTTRIHWEKARGNRQQNVDYCSKDNDVLLSHGLPKPVKTITPDRDWEVSIITQIKEEPDDRTVHWLWGEGNIGKTSFCKYLCVHHGAIMLSGRAGDMKNGVIQYLQTNGECPSLVLINIPKSFNRDSLDYEGIEAVKDMCFYSGKYEGGMVCGNCPHLYVFANEPPNGEKLSADRWDIVELD